MNYPNLAMTFGPCFFKADYRGIKEQQEFNDVLEFILIQQAEERHKNDVDVVNNDNNENIDDKVVDRNAVFVDEDNGERNNADENINLENNTKDDNNIDVENDNNKDDSERRIVEMASRVAALTEEVEKLKETIALKEKELVTEKWWAKEEFLIKEKRHQKELARYKEPAKNRKVDVHIAQLMLAGRLGDATAERAISGLLLGRLAPCI